MDAPPVQYVRTSDGVSIAYAVSGQGPPLVLLSGSFEHVQLAWQYPRLQPWLEGLAQRFQLIQIDERGAGMSARDIGADFDFMDYLLDIEAVLAALDAEPVIIFGITNHAMTAIEFAAKHPAKVSALILSGLMAQPVRSAFWSELPAEDWDLFLYSLVPRDFSPEEGHRTVELLKHSFTAESFGRRRRSFEAYKLSEEVASQLRVPALILHAKGYVMSDPANSMHLAQAIGARMTLIDGSTVVGNAEQGLRAIDAFWADAMPAAAVTPSDAALSAREIEVLRLIAAGRSNAQIAQALVISPNTVGRHVSNIFDKIGAANRAEATAYALRHGIA